MFKVVAMARALDPIIELREQNWQQDYTDFSMSQHAYKLLTSLAIYS
jgi:hypothetical protein